jgi:hypothetical protein
MVRPGVSLLRRQSEERPARCKQKRMERGGENLRPEVEIGLRLLIGCRNLELDSVAIPVLDPDLGFRKARKWIGRVGIERELVGESPEGDSDCQPDQPQTQGPEYQLPTEPANHAAPRAFPVCLRRRTPGRA